MIVYPCKKKRRKPKQTKLNIVPRTAQAYGEKRPWTSVGVGVPSHCAASFEQDARDNGFTGVTFDKKGNCKITSRSERRRYLKYRGVRDNDAGYSD